MMISNFERSLSWCISQYNSNCLCEVWKTTLIILKFVTPNVICPGQYFNGPTCADSFEALADCANVACLRSVYKHYFRRWSIIIMNWINYFFFHVIIWYCYLIWLDLIRLFFLDIAKVPWFSTCHPWRL